MNFEHNDVPMRFTCALPVQSEARFQKKNGRKRIVPCVDGRIQEYLTWRSY